MNIDDNVKNTINPNITTVLATVSILSRNVASNNALSLQNIL